MKTRTLESGWRKIEAKEILFYLIVLAFWMVYIIPQCKNKNIAVAIQLVSSSSMGAKKNVLLFLS